MLIFMLYYLYLGMSNDHDQQKLARTFFTLPTFIFRSPMNFQCKHTMSQTYSIMHTAGNGLIFALRKKKQKKTNKQTNKQNKQTNKKQNKTKSNHQIRVVELPCYCGY